MSYAGYAVKGKSVKVSNSTAIKASHSVLAVCYSVLLDVAVFCCVLQILVRRGYAVRCSVLQCHAKCVAACCSVLQRVAAC